VAFAITRRRSATWLMVGLLAAAPAPLWNVRFGEQIAVSPGIPVAIAVADRGGYSGARPSDNLRSEPQGSASPAENAVAFSSPVRPSSTGALTNVRDEPALPEHPFTLLGTTVAGKQGVAVVLDSADGRASIVKPGDRLGPLTVVSVGDARLTLRRGMHWEELRLAPSLGASGRVPGQVSLDDMPEAESAASYEAPTLAQGSFTSPDLEVNSRVEKGEAVPNPQ